MRVVYLDSSVLVGHLLGQRPRLVSWGDWERAYTSVLTRVEYFRTIDRLRLQGELDDEDRAGLCALFEEVYESFHRVPLVEAVLSRAADSFPTVVGSLDAIHLASALIARNDAAGPVAMLTHDRQLQRAAAALGFAEA